MAITDPIKRPPRFADKAKLVRQVDEILEDIGVAYDPDATADKVQQMMLDIGIKPEDRIFTKELLRMRYGTDKVD